MSECKKEGLTQLGQTSLKSLFLKCYLHLNILLYS
jgi:hypothetical protein